MRRAGFVALSVVLLLAGCGSGGTDDGRTTSSLGVTAASLLPSTIPSPGAEVSSVAVLKPCPDTDLLAPVTDGLPRLTLSCLGEGPEVTLSGLRGTPMLVNLWASWCGYCRDEMPLLSEFAARAAGRVDVLGVAYQDSRGDAAAAAAAFGVGFPSVLDSEGALLAGRAGLPVTLLVDPSGRVVRSVHGAFTDPAQIDAEVARYLGVIL